MKDDKTNFQEKIEEYDKILWQIALNANLPRGADGSLTQEQRLGIVEYLNYYLPDQYEPQDRQRVCLGLKLINSIVTYIPKLKEENSRV